MIGVRKLLFSAMVSLFALAANPSSGICSAELTVTAGASTDSTTVAAAVLRAFGDFSPQWRYFLEEALGARSGPGYHSYPPARGGASFNAGYPYSGSVQTLEAYAEFNTEWRNRILDLKLGQYRTPFGIYSEGEQSYLGFLRSPLVRSYEKYGVSNYWTDAGFSLLVGAPQLQLEVGAGLPQEKVGARRNRLSETVRLQGYRGTLIAGISYTDTEPARERIYSKGRSRFWGSDVRWMNGPLQLRGEFITGRPSTSTGVQGWYADAIFHTRAMERMDWVARAECVQYSAGAFSFCTRRSTVGGRLELGRGLYLTVNALQQPGMQPQETAADAAFAYTVRY